MWLKIFFEYFTNIFMKIHSNFFEKQVRICSNSSNCSNAVLANLDIESDKTMQRNSLLNPETEWRIIEVSVSTAEAINVNTAFPEWDACCARDALSFLNGAKHHMFARELPRHSRCAASLQNSSSSRYGHLCLHSDTRTAI